MRMWGDNVLTDTALCDRRVCVDAGVGVGVGAGARGPPAVRLGDVSVLFDRWSQVGGRFGRRWRRVAGGSSVFDSTANLSLLHPGDLGDNSTSHYSSYPHSKALLLQPLPPSVCPQVEHCTPLFSCWTLFTPTKHIKRWRWRFTVCT